MTNHDPPRLRELEREGSELNDLLDAAERDVLPRGVLSRSTERLSAAVGLSVGDLTGLGSSPIDAATAALGSKGTTAASTGAAAAKTAATGATAVTAAATTGKGAAVLAPALSAAAKPLLAVALASATTVAVWKAQPQEPPATPARAPVSAPAVSKRAHPNIDPYAVPPAPIVAPAPAPPVTASPTTQEPAAQRPVAPRNERRELARAQHEAPTLEANEPAATAAEELRSLQAAQAELASNPAGAVQRLRAHAVKWPRGWLDEERAALLVEALLRAGEPAQAERALRELAAHKPRSPALPRLRRMLEQQGAP